MLSLPLLILCLAHELLADQSSYSATPRWGQAVALVEQTLYIHGGRTDPYNSYSYSAAPSNNDLLALSLASPFNTSSPPFDYVGGCSNCSSSSGPAVAWHTLTPFNVTGLLLFGGDPGPNSQTVLPDRNDSSALLGTSSPLDPVWDFETEGWAGEPMRRIYHSAVAAQGKVWIVGGEKADDSGSAFSQHYVFDPSGPSFSPLPTPNSPPDITGHQSVVLSDGRMLVLGGYSPSQKSLIPFTTVWALNAAQGDNLTWSTVSISTASVPTPRRNFVATSLDNGKVLIHGGADATLQNSLSDGWILDTAQSPMVWANVTALTQLGPRRDHFAVGVGSIAIIGFGYAQNGPAAASLEAFDVSSGSFLTSYTPPAAISTPTSTTLLASTQTGSTATGRPGSAEYPQPTPSKGGGGGGGNPSGGGNGSGNGQGGDPSGSSSKNHTTAIILGAVFGVLALLLGAAAATYYMRRRDSQESFHLLSESGDEESPHGDGPIPIAGAGGSREKGLPLMPVVHTIRDRLSRVVPGLAGGGDPQERRDMLAEEDTREFETNGWYNISRHPSSAQSSWTSRRRPTLERVYDSLASLRSVGGAVLEYAAGAAAAGARSLKSREPSAASNANTLDAAVWDEKRSPFDPYTDEFGASSYPPPVVNASRPRGGGQASSVTYADPFVDYFEVASFKDDSDMVYRDDDDDDVKGYPLLRDPPPPPRLASLRAPAASDLAHLTPVSERSSIPTLSDPASSSDTSLAASIPRSPAVASGGASSTSSHDPPHSPRRLSSILDANPPSSQFLRRSSTWWARFAKAPLLDRRSPSVRSQQRPMEFRDPHPPPRLVTIEESTHARSPDSPEGSGARAPRFATHHHGRSASSMHTSRTADSEQLERVASTMQVVRKDASGSSSHRSFLSRDGSGGDASAEPGDISHHPGEAFAGPWDSPPPPPPRAEAFVLSPTAMTREEFAAAALPSPARPSPPPPHRSSSSLVSERVQAYEQRMSQQEPPPPKRPSPPVPARNRLGSTYGLAPRSSLFVANPDHKHSGSGDS